MTLRPIRRDEVRPAMALAARAFADDPLFVHVYPDPATRERGFVIENVAAVRHVFLPLGVAEVAEVDGVLAGVALWLPDGADTPWWRDLLLVPALARAVGLGRLAMVLRDYAAFDAALPEGPYHYLGLLAVAPQAQGRGVGRALVEAGLARADADGRGCYLETSTPGNVRFYEGLGFQVAGTVGLPHGPAHWGMWRPPGGPG